MRVKVQTYSKVEVLLRIKPSDTVFSLKEPLLKKIGMVSDPGSASAYACERGTRVFFSGNFCSFTR